MSLLKLLASISNPLRVRVEYFEFFVLKVSVVVKCAIQYFMYKKRPKSNCMKKWECIVCGWIYDEEKGWPEDGIAPGTKWEDVPEDWLCPDCGVGKEDFEMIEI
jgi:rubredoxin